MIILSADVKISLHLKLMAATGGGGGAMEGFWNLPSSIAVRRSAARNSIQAFRIAY
jgi:hypothetical protein